MFAFLLQLNYHIFTVINTYAGHWAWLDNSMIFCADLLIFLWPLVMLMLWGRPLSWRQRPLRPGEMAIIHECRAVVLWIGVTCLLAYALNLGIEQFLFEPRPFIAHRVHLLVTHPADGSFPSDHAAWSFSVVGMMLFSLPALLRITWQQRMDASSRQWSQARPLVLPLLLMGVALVIACLIGIARVFVGVHYPGDIIGGALSGICAAGIITLLRRRVLQRPTEAILQGAKRIHLA